MPKNYHFCNRQFVESNVCCVIPNLHADQIIEFTKSPGFYATHLRVEQNVRKLMFIPICVGFKTSFTNRPGFVHSIPFIIEIMKRLLSIFAYRNEEKNNCDSKRYVYKKE